MTQGSHRIQKSFHHTDNTGRLTGMVTRWQEGDTYGFITGEDKTSYFLSDTDLPRGTSSLPAGTVVTFTPANSPQPGKRHLRAKSVRVEGTEPRSAGSEAQS